MSQEPIQIKMTHAAVRVSSIKSSMDFFVKLGFKPAWAGQEDWGMVKANGTTLALIEKNHDVHPPHIGLVVEQKEQVYEVHQRLKEMSLPDLGQPKEHRDKSVSFYFKDHDGNQFELLWLPEGLTR